MRHARVRRGPAAAAAVLVSLLVAAAVAAGAEAPTRAEYVDTAEGICKPDALATQRVMTGARADVRAERLPVAARKFAKATAIFAGTIKQISAVPRPAGDLDRLERWFTFLNRQKSYLEQITVYLRQGRAVKAQRLTGRFIHNGNLANYVSLPFGFNYCSFRFSRYG